MQDGKEQRYKLPIDSPGFGFLHLICAFNIRLEDAIFFFSYPHKSSDIDFRGKKKKECLPYTGDPHRPHAGQFSVTIKSLLGTR